MVSSPDDEVFASLSEAPIVTDLIKTATNKSSWGHMLHMKMNFYYLVVRDGQMNCYPVYTHSKMENGPKSNRKKLS